jgi:hypothetical protein
MTPHENHVMDVKGLVRRFGGRAFLFRLLSKEYGIQPRTIDNWCSRGSIPWPWIIRLVEAANLQGWKLVINDWIPALKTKKETPQK